MTAFLDRLLEHSSTLESLRLDADARVAWVNAAYARRQGVEAEAVVGRPITELVAVHEATRLRGWCDGTETTRSDSGRIPMSFVAVGGEPYTLWCHVDCSQDGVLIVGEPEDNADGTAPDDLLRLNNEMATLARENARRRREAEEARAQLAAALEQLRSSYWHLQKIQEVMPICMSCGKVKSDGYEWKSVVDYLRENDIFLSHGYCPVCADAVMRDYGLED